MSTRLLDATLGAFEAEAHGDRRIAAATLAAINWENPDLLAPGSSSQRFARSVRSTSI